MTDMKKGDGDNGKLLYCSFCGKSQHEVRKLIAGPSVFVCDECVELCNDIIREEIKEISPKEDKESLPSPIDIRESLDEYVIGQDHAKKAPAHHDLTDKCHSLVADPGKRNGVHPTQPLDQNI